jgi:hypothetical protein
MNIINLEVPIWNLKLVCQNGTPHNKQTRYSRIGNLRLSRNREVHSQVP